MHATPNQHQAEAGRLNPAGRERIGKYARSKEPTPSPGATRELYLQSYEEAPLRV